MGSKSFLIALFFEQAISNMLSRKIFADEWEIGLMKVADGTCASQIEGPSFVRMTR
jgi:hypothetical protein